MYLVGRERLIPQLFHMGISNLEKKKKKKLILNMNFNIHNYTKCH